MKIIASLLTVALWCAPIPDAPRSGAAAVTGPQYASAAVIHCPPILKWLCR